MVIWLKLLSLLISQITFRFLHAVSVKGRNINKKGSNYLQRATVFMNGRKNYKQIISEHVSTLHTCCLLKMIRLERPGLMLTQFLLLHFRSIKMGNGYGGLAAKNPQYPLQ